MPTVVKGTPKAPFSIATVPMCSGGRQYIYIYIYMHIVCVYLCVCMCVGK